MERSSSSSLTIPKGNQRQRNRQHPPPRGKNLRRINHRLSLPHCQPVRFRLGPPLHRDCLDDEQNRRLETRSAAKAISRRPQTSRTLGDSGLFHHHGHFVCANFARIRREVDAIGRGGGSLGKCGHCCFGRDGSCQRYITALSLSLSLDLQVTQEEPPPPKETPQKN